MTPSLATCAQFFRIGLEAGVCKPDSAREWAISVIGAMDAPPGEVIEVSWHKPLPQLIDDLNSVQGDADLELAGRWLLYILLRSFRTEVGLWQAITAAKQIALSLGGTATSTELYCLLDAVEDELNLAESGTFGTVAECRADLEEIISQHSLPLPSALI
jgi:hypothetical protein